MEQFKDITSVMDGDRRNAVKDEKGFVYTADGKKLIGYEGSETKLFIKEGVEVIADSAFEGRYNDGFSWSVTIGDSVIAIGSSAFKNCPDLTKVVLSDNLCYIGSNAFEGCGALLHVQTNEQKSPMRSVLIPHGVKYLEEGVFTSCTLITSFVLPDGLTNIKDRLFFNCMSLIELTLPSSVVRIGKATFKQSGIERITVPPSVIEIDDEAFAFCDSLQELRLPPSLLSVGNDILKGCPLLERIIISKGSRPRMCELLPEVEQLFVEEE